MTKEYMERGALIARYDAEHVGPPGRARELIATAPAVDVVPVVHGEPTEHLRELLRAEKDGRLVVLPCKIGATVYRFQRYFNSEIFVYRRILDNFGFGGFVAYNRLLFYSANLAD